jgi:hypothetical protein
MRDGPGVRRRAAGRLRAQSRGERATDDDLRDREIGTGAQDRRNRHPPGRDREIGAGRENDI